MKWLFVNAEFPWPIAHGTYLRVYHLARTLASRGEQVRLLAPADSPQGMEAYRAIGAEPLAPATRGEQPSRPTWGPYAHDAGIAAAVRRHSAWADIAVLTHARTLQYAWDARAAGHVIADMVDDLILEETRKLRRERQPLRWLRGMRFLAAQRRYERRQIPFVSATVFVSDADADSFARRHPGCPTAVVANGVDLDYFCPGAGGCDVLDGGGGEDAGPTVLFLGHLSHPPNADAARYLLADIAPRLREEMPGVKVVILGSSPPTDIAGYAEEGTIITGWVDDVRPHLWKADVVVLPMRLGTGIKNKLLEAWAARRAVVATSLACQGAPARHGENLLVADGAEEFARSTCRLLSDAALRGALAAAGQSTVEESFAWSAMADALARAADGRRRSEAGATLSSH